MTYQATPAQKVVEHALERGFVAPGQIEEALLGGQTHEGLLPLLKPHLSASQLAELQQVYHQAQAALESRSSGVRRVRSSSGAIPVQHDVAALVEDGESTLVLNRPTSSPPPPDVDSTTILSAHHASGLHPIPNIGAHEADGESTAVLSARPSSGLHPIHHLDGVDADEATVVGGGLEGADPTVVGSAATDVTVVGSHQSATAADSVDYDESSLPEPGAVLGDYEVVRELARGAMGVVYLGRHRQLGRKVAIKLMLTEGWGSEHLAARFAREGQALAKLDHPNIVRVHQAGSRGENPYMVMDLVDGQSLAQRLKSGWALDGREAAQLTEQLARALEHSHSRGVLHRDLKPDNVLLGSDGRPRITDFGLTNAQEEQERLTQTGEMLGTPAYMPPEQASGEKDVIGPCSDIYSLGATLYSMITGERLFEPDSTVNLITKVIREIPRSPREVKADVELDLATICMKCLEKAPRDRYASAADLADDLGRFLRGEPIVARPLSLLERVRRRLRRDRALARVTLALALALTAVAGLAIQRQAFHKSTVDGSDVNLSIAPLPSSVHGGRLTLRFGVEPITARVRVRVGKGGWTRLPTSKEYATELDLPLGENVVTIEAIQDEDRDPVRRTVNVSCLSPRWWVEVRDSEVRPSFPLPEGVGFGAERGTYVHAKSGVVFVWIPPGEFVFGLNLKEGARVSDQDELPSSLARITRGLFLGRYELTREQYRAFCRATGRAIPAIQEDDGRLPAVNVAWDDAQAYCAWAGLRLPTEGEWEYAAEGGMKGTDYPWGVEDPTSRHGNWRGKDRDGLDAPTPVGSFPAGVSRWGCHDMSGNVWEWTQDIYVDHYPRVKDVRIDPKNEEGGSQRVRRGGSYHSDDPRLLRAGFRRSDPPTDRKPDQGFRVALTPD